MDISVLGGFSVSAGGGDIAPKARKPRALLALLVLNSGRIVPHGSIVTELWGEEPPMRVMPALQTYVYQLRRALAAPVSKESPGAAQEMLVTHPNGYRLSAELTAGDIAEFDRLSQLGSQAVEQGDVCLAAELLQQALAGWGGEPLADIEAGPLLQAASRGMQERKLGTLELYYDVQLRRGKHREILADLTVGAAEQPLHEGLQAQLMIALYRSGRRTQALDVYHAFRRQLVDELGIEPSVGLRELNHAVILDDLRLRQSASALDPSLWSRSDALIPS